MQRWLIVFMICAALVGMAVAQESGPEVTTLTIAPINLQAGESLIYDIVIDCLADGCSAFDITLSYDPALIQIDKLEVGPYLGSDVFVVENAIDAEAGTLRLAAAALGDLPETDDRVLLRIYLTALDSGEATFTVEHLDVGDLIGSPVEVEVIEGEPAPEATPTPTLAPTAVPVPVAVTCEYTVQSGDTLFGIAMANNVSLEDIMSLNNLADARFISIGQKLQLPTTNCVAGLTSGGSSGGSGQVRPGGKRYFEVWDCRHLGSNVFEWYGVEIGYDTAGNPISEQRVDGPHTGVWRPGCPAGEAPPSGSGGSGGGGGRRPTATVPV